MSTFMGKRLVAIVLAKAKQNMEKDGKLFPTLFVVTKGGENLILGLENFPDTFTEKFKYLAALGVLQRKNGKDIAEVLFLSDAWYAKAKDKQDAYSLPVSQRSDKAEAVVVMGRDAIGAHQTMVVQPYQRDPNGMIIWEKPAVEMYDQPVSEGISFAGLLDALFLVPRNK